VSKYNIVVIYDGECGFCNRSVLFLLKRDKEKALRFSASNSCFSKSELAKHGIPVERLDTLVLLERGEAHTYSDAGLKIAKYLKFPWSLFYYLWVVPKRIRDPMYNFIARNRYRLSGRTTSCGIPDDSSRSQFIEDSF
jgi:predicted DCC family thiol-disulfide oxidoreductase YuxK